MRRSPPDQVLPIQAHPEYEETAAQDQGWEKKKPLPPAPPPPEPRGLADHLCDCQDPSCNRQGLPVFNSSHPLVWEITRTGLFHPGREDIPWLEQLYEALTFELEDSRALEARTKLLISRGYMMGLFEDVPKQEAKHRLLVGLCCHVKHWELLKSQDPL